MTDSTSIFQHASFTAPNRSEGYCTDDNARALILAVLLSHCVMSVPVSARISAALVSCTSGTLCSKAGLCKNPERARPRHCPGCHGMATQNHL